MSYFMVHEVATDTTTRYVAFEGTPLEIDFKAQPLTLSAGEVEEVS